MDGSAALSSPLGLSSLMSLVASLVLVVGAILFVGWFYSRMRGVNVGGGNVITVLAAQALGPKERIIVVQIGGKQIAVGVTPSSLHALHVFENPVIQSPEREFAESFSEKLRAAFGGLRSK